MTVFRAEMEHLADRLDLPEPVRTRTLLEIMADLDALHAAGLESGLPPTDARRRALEICDLSDPAVRALARVHATPLERLIDALPGPSRSRWESALLAVLIVVLAVAAGALVSTPGFIARGSIFTQPLALLLVAAAATFATRAYALWIRRSHHPDQLRRGHVLLPALSVAMVVCGTVGFWCELLWAARRARAEFTDLGPATLDWLVGGSGLLVASLVAAMFTGVAWLILEHKAARCEAAALATLLDPDD